ncbi:ankyrin repeat domain-containing protein [Hymenobacter psychrotolerans]|uniref:Ankyrin repeat-containing protein n=1 Tax=Hymenobacter psychrotolerans DSM 18569 TaxID=1121959 RepID=A0A1M7FLA9_9BACT|nr:ankyrin repeat domain-containing protein [Hymenobacter psychrotolerans]SHM04479.1 Ankyrin repeat-containing protein [Hymenobacter psychrotolerans DSM 18569]
MKTLLLVFALFLGSLTAAHAQTPTQKVYAAVVKNQPEVLERLLAGGADANAPVEMMPGFPTNFLILAAGNGQLELVKILVKHKAQIDQTDSFQATALMAAAAQGSLEVVEFLLANGANPKAKDKEGKDVLANAKEGGNAAVVKLIQTKSR